MAKKLFEGLWDKITGVEQYRQEQEQLERERQQKEAAARREEEARRQRLIAQQKKDFLDEVYMHLYRIEQKVEAGYNNPEDDYVPVKKQEQTARNNGWMDDYIKLVLAHIVRLRKKVVEGVSSGAGVSGLCDALSAASCLKNAEYNPEQPTQMADFLFQTTVIAFSTAGYLDYGDYNDYGRCKFPLDDPDEMKRITECADQIMARIEESENVLSNLSSKNLYEGINVHMRPQLVSDACMMMWFYAKKWPFDVNAFEKARKFYLSHTAYHLRTEEGELLEIGPAEEVLARVYAKNRIGGLGTARQEKPYIDLWLEKKLAIGDVDPCYALAHGLAWMELYELELDVLRQLIQAGADVPPQLQDRLTFLENGGTTDIKIYDIEPFDNIYFFDSSVPEWSGKDLSTFFRKVALKKTQFKYSLAMNKWTKTLPLASGQKISHEVINRELEALAADFDGEVNLEIRNAAAINLSNVVFPDAALFTFNSIRNQCVDILFYCEKFGRNLNITIFTLFTPDYNLEFEELEKYCVAIKDNMYVESFRESILQVVDEAIKVRQTVYEDEEAPHKKMVFDD